MVKTGVMYLGVLGRIIVYCGGAGGQSSAEASTQ